jgi:hypothetical protein
MCYEVAIASAGGDEAMLAKSPIISLEGARTNWYSRLPLKCIYSKQSSAPRKIFCHALSARKKHYLIFTEGSCN